MRKLLFLILLLPAMAWGQNTTTLPVSTTSTTLQARVLGTDSLRSFYIASGQSYNQWYTATQINKLFRTSGSLFNKHADSLFARAVDLYNNQTVGGNKTYTGNNIYSGTQDYNNTFNINNSANLNGVFYWTTGRIDPANGYIHMWDWFLDAKRIDAVVQRFYYNYGTGGHDDIKYDKTARTFNLVYSDARGESRILTTLDTVSGGAIAGSYKLKSDSTGATGYQTQYRTDLRYLKLTGGALSGNITAPTANITGTTTSTAANPLFATIDATTGAIGKSAEVVSTNPTRGNLSNAVALDLNTVSNSNISFLSTTSTNTPFTSVGGLYASVLNNLFQTQMVQSRTANSLALRANNNGTWGLWKTLTFGADGITITTPAVTSTLYGTGASSITSAQLATSLTNETGSGVAVFDNAPSLTNPTVTTQAAGDNSTKAASTAYADRVVTDTASVQQIINTKNVVFDGDSFVAGQGSFNNTVVSQAATLMNLIPYNNGIAGTTSAQILARVTAATGRLGYSHVIWSGRNDIATATTAATIQANIASTVSALGHTRYLIVGILPDNSEAVGSANYIKLAAVNTNSASVYGSRFINALAVLQAHGDGSANDNADIAAGRVPRSLQSDALHLNPLGYSWIADAINTKKGLLIDQSTKLVNVRNIAANNALSDQFNIPALGKYLIGGLQAITIPNQTTAGGSIIVGDGAKNVSTTGGNTLVGLSTTPGLTGNLNTFIGNFAGFSASSASQNTVVGYTAGANASGNYNWSDFFGVQAGNNATSTFGSMALGYFSQLPLNGSTNYQMSIKNAIYGNDMDGQNATISTGKIGFFIKAPAAKVDIIAGTTSLAPLGLNSGPLLTTPLAGKMEFLTDRLYFTQTTGTTRQQIAYVSDVAPAVVVSAAATLTLNYGIDYVFSGSTTTYTLPAISASNATRKDIITIKNRGTGNITLNSASGSAIYDGSAVASITISPGSAITLIQDGTFFNKE